MTDIRRSCRPIRVVDLSIGHDPIVSRSIQLVRCPSTLACKGLRLHTRPTIKRRRLHAGPTIKGWRLDALPTILLFEWYHTIIWLINALEHGPLLLQLLICNNILTFSDILLVEGWAPNSHGPVTAITLLIFEARIGRTRIEHISGVTRIEHIARVTGIEHIARVSLIRQETPQFVRAMCSHELPTNSAIRATASDRA